MKMIFRALYLSFFIFVLVSFTQGATLLDSITVSSELVAPTPAIPFGHRPPPSPGDIIGETPGTPGSTDIKGNGSSFTIDPSQFGAGAVTVTLDITSNGASIGSFLNGTMDPTLGLAVKDFSTTSGGDSFFVLKAASSNGIDFYGLNQDLSKQSTFTINPTGTTIGGRRFSQTTVNTFSFKYTMTLLVDNPTTFSLNYTPLTLSFFKVLNNDGEDMTVTVAKITPAPEPTTWALMLGGLVFLITLSAWKHHGFRDL